MAKLDARRCTVVARAFLVGVIAGLAALWFLEAALPNGLQRIGDKVVGQRVGSRSWAHFGKETRSPTTKEVPETEALPAPAAERNNAGVALARERHWLAAVQQLRAALQLQPGSSLIQRNLQQVLLGWGVEQLQAGKTLDAIQNFLEAARLGADPEVQFWLGQAWLQHGEPAKALEIWQKTLEEFPDHPHVLLALGELWEQRDERTRALEYLARARAAGVESPQLARKIERLSREVDVEWDYQITRSARFDFRHPVLDDSRVLELVVASFEKAYDDLLGRLGVAPTAPVRVVLYPSTEFYAVTQSPDWAGGVYTGRIQVPVGGLAERDRTRLEHLARHELAHALVTEWSRGRAPAWFQEGLAMWCEDEFPGERRDWALASQAGARAASLSELPASFAALDQRAAEVAYSLSYLAVLSLSEQYGVTRMLSFARACGDEPWGEAFRSAFGREFVDFAVAVSAGAP
ncbi:MAG: hypothetical protein KatS3mg077_2341 [Candidatus Binatia bacterium]|nr:MAG: hypothetical protein KatS3mg077_2341 [Candidatus Binatia bacterium]